MKEEKTGRRNIKRPRFQGFASGGVGDLQPQNVRGMIGSQRPGLSGQRDPVGQSQGSSRICLREARQAQRFQGPTLGRLAPLSLGEIGDAPKLAGLPKPPGTAPRNMPGGLPMGR